MTKQNKIAILEEAFKTVQDYENSKATHDVVFSKEFITIENRYPDKEEEMDFSSKYKVFIDGYSLRMGTLYKVQCWIGQLIKLLKL